MPETHYVHRDLDWLNFNGRVLQEAKDTTLPVYERIKFLAIFSSNLDEYYRVKVAALQKLKQLKKKRAEKWLTFAPKELITRIAEKVDAQQEAFGEIWRNEILPELAKNNIILQQDEMYLPGHDTFVHEFFYTNILSYLSVHLATAERKLDLENSTIYLAVQLQHRNSKSESIGLVKISSKIPRFIQLPSLDSKHYITFLEDIIRAHFKLLFPEHKLISQVYSLKINRDEDVDIDDEFSGNLLVKIKEQLEKRKYGVPVRLLYDNAMPDHFLEKLIGCISVNPENKIPGGRYHNLHDLFNLPNPVGSSLELTPLQALLDSELEKASSLFKAFSIRDYLLHYPYHSYKYVLRFFNEAIVDPEVTRIQITLYRISQHSQIANALSNAARSGKEVIVFVEVKARYDELNNIHWADEMKKAGVKIIYSVPDIKVHAKVALVTKTKKNGKHIQYAYLSTGNFNEKTARIYADYGLFTANKNITLELASLFLYLQSNATGKKNFRTLLVSRSNMKKKLLSFIDKEIAAVKKGLPGKIHLKMNSLDDHQMIEKLYEASQQGVAIKLIVRGGCSLVPGIKGTSDTINAYRLVDRYLEHARIYYFYNQGKEKIYLSSADWMNRNLNKRIEVAFPVLNKSLKNQICYGFDLQWADNTKLTSISENEVKSNQAHEKAVRAQYAMYYWLKENTTNLIN